MALHVSVATPVVSVDPGPDRTSSPFQLDVEPSSISQPGSPSERWRAAARKIQLGLAISSRFRTLRDRYGVNEIEVSELKTIKKLGEGAFAVVEQCLYTPSSGGEPFRVACKKLKPEIMSQEEDLNSFMAEVALMRKLKHQSIVEYIGVGSTDKSSEAAQRSSMFLVTELMEGGTLKRLVMNQMVAPHSRLYSLRDALRWCIQIASALAYMHTANPMVIHRDLKLDNILLKGSDPASQEAKLADFGLVAFINKQHGMRVPLPAAELPGSGTRKAEQLQKLWSSRSLGFIRQSESVRTSHSDPPAPGIRGSLKKITSSLRRMDHGPHDAALYNLAGANDSRSSLNVSKVQLTGRTGTLMYMAPEMFKNEKYNEKVDVFSFGMVMYELLHKYMMVFAVSVKGTEEEIEQYAERVAGGWRPPINKHLPPEVESLISDSWAQESSSRPSMAEVLKRLNHIQDSNLLDLMPAQQPGCTCVIS